MNQRRNFLRLASAVAIPAAAVAVSSGIAQADDGSVKEFLGTWSSVHSLPFPPGSFREFLSFADGGVVHETNSFLNTASNLDFSMFGLPKVMNASDGLGNWARAGKGAIDVVFRKMLFDGARQNFGDLRATGRLTSDGFKFFANWNVEVILLNGGIVPFGPATSEGTRLK